MDERGNIYRILAVFISIGVIIAAAVGIFYSYGGERFTFVNMYGNSVEMYGDGVYAYNSVLTVANRLGSDVIGIFMAGILLVMQLYKRKTYFNGILKTSVVIALTYYLFFLVFEIAMNDLYFLYVICLGMSFFLSFVSLRDLFRNMQIPEALKEKPLAGTGIFLISVGVITAILWGFNIITAMAGNSFGELLGNKATEVTYGIDLTVTCPVFILCGIWLLRKKEIGYKLAPILLNIMIVIAALVISQRIYCAVLGIEIPIGALLGFIVSFVIMGLISFLLMLRLMKKYKAEIHVGGLKRRQ